jgi:phosphotransferase system enzyme I (PtsI)
VIFEYVVLVPNVLTVKDVVVLDVAMVTSTPPAGATAGPAVLDAGAALRGTPVVPGLAYGPVVLVAQEVSPAAVAAYGDGGHRCG